MKFELVENGHHHDTVEAEDLAHAMALAREDFDPSVYDTSGGTAYIDIEAALAPKGGCKSECEDGECGDCHPQTDSHTERIDPPEPECPAAPEHDWQSPHEIVDGLPENPGVHGHGGGVVITTVCAGCGAYRQCDTWAHRRDTGEEGLESIRYLEPDEKSTAWAERPEKRNSE